MNSCIIIGNLVRKPELKQFADGNLVCNFTVAVNRWVQGGEQDADFFNVAAWGTMGENCARYLDKGRKVMCRGRIGARAYTGRDGGARASLELTASEVEFLSPRERDAGELEETQDTGEFQEVEDDELPFS